MRYPGENAAGRAPGRRQNPSGRMTPPEARPAGGGAGTNGGTGGARAGRTAASDASLFAPGYTGGRSPGADQVPAGGAWSGQASGAIGKGPVRGFPPAPGQPSPLYPPGQFAAWNRTPAPGENGYDPGLSGPLSGTWQVGYPDASGSSEAGYSDAGYSDAGYADSGYADAGYAEQGHAPPGYADTGPLDPGYAALAVSDPAADVTNTGSWSTVDDTAARGGWGDLRGPGGHGLDADPLGQDMPDGPGLPAGLADPAGLAGPAAGPVLAGPVLTGPGTGQFDAAADQAFGGPNQGLVTGPDQHVAGGLADRSATGTERAVTGPFELATPAPFRSGSTGPSQRVAADPGTRETRPSAPGRGQGGRGRGSRGRKRSRGPSKLNVLLICGAVAAIVIAFGGAYYVFSRGHKAPAPAADARPKATVGPSADPSPSPSLGPWGHIQTRALDPVPLTLAELFPASFTSGTASYVMTVEKAKTHCAPALVGSGLVAAVNRADCTQAMRASYLSSVPKLMGTIGVLNLVTATAAERAGKAAGPSEFIAQLTAARGPTKNLTKGTGFEAAEVKGHYLVLVWAEFANLHTPRTPLQKSELEEFISTLMQKTANVSLATRQVTGSPPP
jgi:hypothetical protein